MALLVTNEKVDYNTLRTTLQLTDGNLASHLRPLEMHEYITIHKVFIGKRTQTTYSSTIAGREAFNAHLSALERMIKIGREE